MAGLKKINLKCVIILRPSIWGEITSVQNPNRTPGHLPSGSSAALPHQMVYLSDFPSAVPFYHFFFFFLPYVNIFIDALSAFVIEHSLEGIMMNPDTAPLELTNSRELGRKRNPKRECLQSTILNSYSQGFYGYFLKGDFQRFMLPASPCL